MPEITRRTLLRGGMAMGAVAVPLLWSGSASAAAPRSRASVAGLHHAQAERAPGQWTRANFQPHHGKSFTLTGPDGRVTVTLVEIGNLVGAHAATAQHQFSLLFKAGKTAVLPGGLYTLRGAHFKPMTLFVSPVDRGRKARYVQAVVNRLS